MYLAADDKLKVALKFVCHFHLDFIEMQDFSFFFFSQDEWVPAL